MSCLCKDEVESVPLRPCSKPFGLVFISKHKKDNMLLSNTAADDTNRVRIKLCGMTQEDDVLTAVQAGADAVGFICYPASARYVTPSRLMCLLCVLQFHGNESRAFCDQFHVPYIKAVAVKDPTDLLKAQDEFPMAVALLAESPSHEYGGTGQTFDWQGVAGIRDQIRKPLIVAGGLKEQNVSQAIRLMRPWAVDAASGVETARGIKDHDKILRFVEAVRRGGDCDGSLAEQ